MAKLAIKKASTDVTVYLFVQASNVTTGAGLTGLTFETASLVASYVRPGAARAALTLATQTVDGAHSDGGFVEVDSTNMPGVYRLDLSDAVCATGVNSVVVMLKGAANMAPVLLEIQLVSYDPNDAVRIGITALPNAAADAAGGLPISDAGGLDLDSQIKTDIDDLITRLTAARAGYLDKLNVSGALAHSDAAATYKADVSGLATPTNITAGTITTVTDVTNAVKISAGTGAGQLDFTSGVIKANLAQILGTALTETAGQIAAAFKKFFDIGTPTGTVNSLPDAVAGANGGLPTTNGTKVNQTVDLTAGQSIAANGGTVATVTNLTNAPTDMAKESTLTAIKGATWSDETLVTIQAAAESAPSAADVADAVWDETISGHTGGTTFGGKNQKVVPSETINDYKADVSAITGAALSAAGIDAILDEVVVGTYTMRQLIALFAAKLHGTAAGGNTDTITYDSLDGTTTSVIVETVDEDGNRTVVLTV